MKKKEEQKKLDKNKYHRDYNREAIKKMFPEKLAEYRRKNSLRTKKWRILQSEESSKCDTKSLELEPERLELKVRKFIFIYTSYAYWTWTELKKVLLDDYNVHISKEECRPYFYT